MGMGPKLATLSSQQLQQMGQQYKDDAIMLGLVLHEKQRRDAIQAASREQPEQQPPINEQVVQSLGPQQQQQMPPPQQGQGPMPPQQGPQGPMPPQQGPQGPMPPQQGQGPMPPQRMADGGMTGLPEDSGIGALPAPNIARMAGGGIASFADDGLVKTAKATAPSAETLAYLAETDRLAGLPPGTSARQIYTESGFNPDALGPMTRSGQASGAAQVVPDTLKGLRKQMGNDKLDPTNPQDAMAMHRFLMQQNMARYKDPEKALRAYNSGTDTKRWDNPETNAYVSKILAKAPAADQTVAATPSVPAKTFASSTGNERVLGALDAARSVASGVAALPLSAAYGLYQKAISGENEDVAAKRAQQAIIYGPSTGAGEDILSGLGGVADFLHLPAYTPGMQASGKSRLRGGASEAQAARAGKAAEQAVEDVKKAQVATYSGPAQNVGPNGPMQPPPAVKSPGSMGNQYGSLEAQKYNAELQRTQGVLGNAADTAAKTQVNLERARALSRDVQGTGTRAAGIAALSGAVPPIVAGGEGANRAEAEAAAVQANRPAYETDIHRPPFSNMPDKAKDILADAAKKSVPAAERRSMGFTGDDWTMLGLQMLANPSPYFLQTVGKAGVATLANIQQQKQLEAERKYHGALGRKAEAEAGMYESGARVEKQIADEVEKDMANWLKTTEGQMSDATKQAEVKRRMYQEVAMRYPGYKSMAAPDSRYSAADAILNKGK